MTGDVVPLPDSLSKCGCRYAPTIHATDCAVAIAFDAIPLMERPEYELGRRFAAISWDFPMRISARIHVDVQLDPIAVIAAHADEYERFVPDASYESWEKPIVFLAHLIEEQSDFGGVWFGSRRLSSDRSYMDDITEHPQWTPEDTARLHEALGHGPQVHPQVHPDQGTLEVG